MQRENGGKMKNGVGVEEDDNEDGMSSSSGDEEDEKEGEEGSATRVGQKRGREETGE